MNNNSISDQEPLSRVEEYLQAYLNGDRTVPVPEPLSRVEEYLQTILSMEPMGNVTFTATTLPVGSQATVTKTVDQSTGAVTVAIGIPETVCVTDDTLTVSDAPADAKATGDRLTAIQAAVGSPLKASTVADMTNTEKVYVYTGSETGYTAGHWYYYDNNTWNDGGVYNAVAVNTDDTLTVADQPADAKKVGDEINDLKGNLTEIVTMQNLADEYFDQGKKTVIIYIPIRQLGFLRGDS